MLDKILKKTYRIWPNKNLLFILIYSNSQLVIHRMGEHDEGYYACQVRNDFGSVETKAYLRVGAVQAHFNKAFADRIEAIEGKDIVLECEVSGKREYFHD